MKKQIINRLYIGKNVQGVETLSTQTIINTVLAYASITSFTVYETLGVWNNEKEKSIVIECISDDAVFTKQEVKKIKDILCQDAIAVSRQEALFELI